MSKVNCPYIIRHQFLGLFVSSGRSSNPTSPGVVTVIPTSNNTSCGQFPVGISPTGIVYTTTYAKEVYVVNEGSNNVSVLSNGCPNYLAKLAHEKSG
jgi:DNA-binding beta-propeller fold protein YncE